MLLEKGLRHVAVLASPIQCRDRSVNGMGLKELARAVRDASDAEARTT